MSSYSWCQTCQAKTCQDGANHPKSWRADFLLAGRYSKRIRKVFSNRKDADSFEHVTKADYIRGTYIAPEPSRIRFNEFFREYEEKHIRRHMRGYTSELYRLKHFLKMVGDRPLSALKHADGDSYIQRRLNENVSKTTINREITSLKTMLKWAVDNSYLKTNPFLKLKKFDVEVIKIRWLNDVEIKQIELDCIKNKRFEMLDIFHVALNTGFRLANLKSLTANDIINQRIRARRTKSGKEYEVPINRNLAAILTRLIKLRPTGPLLDFKNFRHQFEFLIKDPSVTLHTFRHTFAAQCLKRGIPIDRVCQWLGHYSVEFTRKHYGHLCPNQEDIEINMLNLGTPVSKKEVGIKETVEA